MKTNRIKNLILVGICGFLLVAASGLYSVTRYTSGHHISDSRNPNATGTPVLMVDGKGSGVAFEVRDGATPVFRIPDGGGFSFPSGGNITLGGGLAADASLIYDGAAQDFHITLDDSSDDLVIGLGSAPDTTNAFVIDENLDITLCDATASDCDITYDGIAQDYYIALDDSEDDLVIGLGSTVGTTPIIRLDELLDVTLCDASASDCDVTWDGIAQDYYVAIDDGTDDFLIGLGAVIGTTPIISMDENQDVVFAERVTVNGVQGADSAATNETLEIAITTPVDTTGVNTHNGFTCDFAIGDSTGGTNTATCLQIDGVSGDAEVTEIAANIGAGWDNDIVQQLGAENLGMLKSVQSTVITFTAAAGGSGTLATITDGEIWFVHSVFIRTTTNFDATGDDVTFVIGDGNDPNGFISAIDANLQAAFTEATGYAAGWYGIENGSGGEYTLDDGGPFVYAPSGADETIDWLLDETSGETITAGQLTAYVTYTRIQ